MLFITNRQIKESTKSKRNRSIHFKLNENAPSNSLYYCERKSKDNYVELGSEELLRQLKINPAEQILFYIHGFSNLPEDHIFPKAMELQKLFDGMEKNLVCVVPIIWPCDNDFGIIKDYWDDQKSADMSAFSIARILERFLIWRDSQKTGDECFKRINVLAHSMGNRVLRKTLKCWNKYDLKNGVPQLFRNIFMVAADVVNETLEYGESGEYISQAARNVVVYYAADDLALRASKISNLKNKIASRRLGHTGPEKMDKVPKNVYSVDCDNYNYIYDVPVGHNYFTVNGEGQPGEIFKHIFTAIKTGRVKQRQTIL